MLELVRPDVAWRAAWTEAHREWGPGLHEDGFGLALDDDPDTEAGFHAWVDRLGHDEAETWWIVDDGTVLGGIALRSTQDARVRRDGHLGYGIRPSARGRGIAVWAVRRVLLHAAASGVDTVTAVCRQDNAGSVAVLEHFPVERVDTEDHGGVRVRRYTLTATGTAPLRAVTPADVDELRAFLRRSDLTTAGLDAPSVRLWVERGADGEVVGSTGFELSADGDDALLRSVAVPEGSRGVGTGTRLARFALTEAARAGATRAWLFSRRSGPFWQGLGFVGADRRELAERLPDAHQVRLFAATGQLDREVAWTRELDG